MKPNDIFKLLIVAPSLGQAGKPKKIRLHSLRKYFRNNMNADTAFITFWMGHSLGVDAHYISRDIEEHRKRYKEGYKNLQILTPNKENLTDLYQQIREKDAKIQEIEQKMAKFEPLLDLIKDSPTLEQLLKDIKETRYARIESENSDMWQIPREVIDKLPYKKMPDGEEYKEIQLDQLKRLSAETNKQKETNQTENQDNQRK